MERDGCREADHCPKTRPGCKPRPHQYGALLNKGAGMEVYDNEGKTPLHCSVFNERMKGSQCLLDAGFPVDCVDGERQTAMHEAASKGNWR